MAGQIRLTPEEMHNRAREYRTESENIGQVISTMDRLLGQLEMEWEGAASRSFGDQYRELRPAFEKAQQLVETISTQLDQTAEAVSGLDQEIASKFGVY